MVFSCVLLLTLSAVDLLTPEQVIRWQEDLQVYERKLSDRHIDLFHSLSEAQFKQGLAQIHAKLSQSTEQQVIVALMQLHHSVGDGHTAIPLWGRGAPSFPFEFLVQRDQVWVVGVGETHRHLLGARLLAVNGRAAATVIEQLAPVVPFVENPYSRDVRVGHYLTYTDVLLGLGIIQPGNARFHFELDGKQETIEVAPGKNPALTHQLKARRELEQRVVVHDENLWMAMVDEGQTLYIYLSRYPAMDAMTAFAKKVQTYAADKQSKNLIIDFRDCFGGNYFVGLELASFLVLLDSLDWQHGIYTLISNNTFSAAMSNSAQFRQLLNAKLVGQPTGARPYGYQDGDSFTLPHSGLMVMYSKRLYRFQDVNAITLLPDTFIPLTFDDIKAGKDRVLDWVLADITRRKQVSP